MANPTDKPQSLSEAIEKIENASHSKVQNFKEILEKDYAEIRKTIDELKPYLDDLKTKIESDVTKTKNEVAENIKANPWVAIGVVGVFAFILGWFFGQRKKD